MHPSEDSSTGYRASGNARATRARSAGWVPAACIALGRLLLRLPRAAAIAIVLGWLVAIYALSARSSTGGSEGPSWMGFVLNLGHAPLFGLLALWLTLLLPREGGWPRLGRAEFGWVLAAVLAYAVSDELHQVSVPGRSAQVLDVVTDVVGAGATLAVIECLASRRSGALAPDFWLRIALGLVACAVAAAAATFLPELLSRLGITDGVLRWL